MRVISCCLLILVFMSLPVFADKAERGLYLDQTVGAAVQPLGALSVTKFYWRIPLYDRPGILWESARVDIGVDNRLSPTYEAPFAYVSVSPIAFLDFRGRAGYMQFYRGLGYGFTRLPSYDAGYSDSDRKDIHNENKGGTWLDGSAALKLAYGHAAFMNTFTVNRVDFGRGFFYEPNQDVVMKCTDHSFNNDCIAVWKGDGFAAGLNHYLVYVPGSEYRSDSLSLIGVWYTTLASGTELNAGAKAGVYLRNRYYRHEFTGTAWFGFTARFI